MKWTKILTSVFNKWFVILIAGASLLISGIVAFSSMPKRNVPVIDIPLSMVQMTDGTECVAPGHATCNALEASFDEWVTSFEKKVNEIDPKAEVSATIYLGPVLDANNAPTGKFKYNAVVAAVHDYVSGSPKVNAAKREEIRAYLANDFEKGTRTAVMPALPNYSNDLYIAVSNVNEATLNTTVQSIRDKLSNVKGISKTSSLFKEKNYYAYRTIDGNSVKTDIITFAFDDGIDITKLGNDIDAAINENILTGDNNSKVFINKIDEVNKAVSSVLMNLLISSLIVALIVFIVLGAWNAINIAISLPIIIFSSLLINSIIGFTFETMMMAGIIITIGMVVDNAVVIAEDVEAKREEGEDLIPAIIATIKQNWIPVLGATGTTIAAFLPIILIPGISGEFTKTMTSTVVFAILLSYISAMTIVPAAIIGSTKLVNKITGADAEAKKTKGRIKKPFKIGDKLFTKGFYKKVWGCTKFASNKAIITLSIVFVMLIGSFMIKPGNELFPPLDTHISHIQYSVNTDSNNPTVVENELKAVREEISKVLAADPIKQYVSDYLYTEKGDIPSFGSSSSIQNGQNAGRFLLYTNRNGQTIRDFNILLNQKLSESTIIAAKGNAIGEILTSGFTAPDVGLNVIAKGATLDNSRKSFYALQTKIDEVLNRPDPENTGKTYRDRFASFTYPRYTSPDGGTTVNPSGTIVKKSGDYAYLIEGKLKDGQKLGDVRTSIQKYVSDTEALSYAQSNSAAASAAMMASMARGGIIALVVIMLIGFAIFRSIKPTLIMMLTLPATFIGIMVMLGITGEAMSMTGTVGIIALAGIVVNNGILLIDRFLTLVKKGNSHADAINLAVKDRIRPIIISNITTVCGLLPLALGTDGFFKPMAIIMIGGIVTNALLCIFVTPALVKVFYFVKFKKTMENGGPKTMEELEEYARSLIKDEIAGQNAVKVSAAE